MFGHNKRRNKLHSKSFAFGALLTVVLVGAVYIFALQRNVALNAFFQARQQTLSAQLQSSCSDLDTQEGRQECSDKIDEISSTLAEYEEQIQNSR